MQLYIYIVLETTHIKIRMNKTAKLASCWPHCRWIPSLSFHHVLQPRVQNEGSRFIQLCTVYFRLNFRYTLGIITFPPMENKFSKHHLICFVSSMMNDCFHHQFPGPLQLLRHQQHLRARHHQWVFFATADLEDGIRRVRLLLSELYLRKFAGRMSSLRVGPYFATKSHCSPGHWSP